MIAGQGIRFACSYVAVPELTLDSQHPFRLNFRAMVDSTTVLRAVRTGIFYFVQLPVCFSISYCNVRVPRSSSSNGIGKRNMNSDRYICTTIDKLSSTTN